MISLLRNNKAIELIEYLISSEINEDISNYYLYLSSPSSIFISN